MYSEDTDTAALTFRLYNFGRLFNFGFATVLTSVLGTFQSMQTCSDRKPALGACSDRGDRGGPRDHALAGKDKRRHGGLSHRSLFRICRQFCIEEVVGLVER